MSPLGDLSSGRKGLAGAVVHGHVSIDNYKHWRIGTISGGSCRTLLVTCAWVTSGLDHVSMMLIPSILYPVGFGLVRKAWNSSHMICRFYSLSCFPADFRNCFFSFFIYTRCISHTLVETCVSLQNRLENGLTVETEQSSSGPPHFITFSGTIYQLMFVPGVHLCFNSDFCPQQHIDASAEFWEIPITATVSFGNVSIFIAVHERALHGNSQTLNCSWTRVSIGRVKECITICMLPCLLIRCCELLYIIWL